MIFNGRAFSRERLRHLQEVRKEHGPLSLGVVVASSDPVTSSYITIKERNAASLDIPVVRYVLSEEVTQEEALAAVDQAATHSGMIIQLPLPVHLNADALIARMPLTKDVDVISPDAFRRFSTGTHVVMPPVASAINEIIDAHSIQVEGTRAVVVGKGRLVGLPAYHLLKLRGAEVVALDADDSLAALHDADIVVLGAGSPHLVTPDMVREGVVVFDAGTSESGGVVVGDAAPSVADKASFFTPVPGGIGPVAVVEIFANLFALASLRP